MRKLVLQRKTPSTITLLENSIKACKKVRSQPRIIVLLLTLEHVAITFHLNPSDFRPGLASSQISQEDGLFYPPYLITISEPSQALAAMEIIIDQGEGANASDPNSHIYKFEHMKIPHDVLPLPTDPRTKNYTNPNVVAVRSCLYFSFNQLQRHVLGLKYLQCYLLLSAS